MSRLTKRVIIRSLRFTPLVLLLAIIFGFLTWKVSSAAQHTFDIGDYTVTFTDASDSLGIAGLTPDSICLSCNRPDCVCKLYPVEHMKHIKLLTDSNSGRDPIKYPEADAREFMQRLQGGFPSQPVSGQITLKVWTELDPNGGEIWHVDPNAVRHLCAEGHVCKVMGHQWRNIHASLPVGHCLYINPTVETEYCFLCQETRSRHYTGWSDWE